MGIYYHFTDYDLWEKVISEEGLVPQKLEEESIVDTMHDVGFNLAKGLWVWDRRNKQIVQDFFIHHALTRGCARGIFLRVKLDRFFLLSEVLKRADYCPDMTHDLIVEYDDAERAFHRDVPFDIYVRPVPPKDIMPIMEIGLDIKRL